ncbi:amidohydrolase [Nocardiopsis sp. HNM0947]|uniref:Amidohydrolase n=1 Tax=Nocardiopsis coralli TaxID=2772213 RepID=A0ABR9P5U3_9ACTN|nr:M20 family metallopeptidase [Nocardiopsis coralli]MBE2999218.1 amidohydrolase [Nocardiopsis coralli]
MTTYDDAAELGDDLVALRHDLHRHPEIGLDLPRTQERVLRALDGLPLETATGTACSSVTAVMRGGDAPPVLLRADMDALPVQERTGVEYASRVDGAMHACGHDLHTAMLAGAARLLADRRGELPGDVVFMFQPGEEGWDGAGVMLEEGVLDAAGPRVGAAFGMHVFSAVLPHGHIATRPGPILAAQDEVRVTVHGAGGHGSTPHRAKDPVTAVSQMIVSLQTMMTREFDVLDPAVLSVGSLHSGSAANVIPDTASFAATVRTFSDTTRDRLLSTLPRLVHGIASAHGVGADVEVLPGYPVTVTDHDETAFAADTAAGLFGDERHHTLEKPLMGSEDFSRVMQAVPGSFIGLGAAPVGADLEEAPFNHSPLAVFDDGVLPVGAALYAELALRRFAEPTASAAAEGERR